MQTMNAGPVSGSSENMRTMFVSFENYDFCAEDGETAPRGLDAAEFFVEEFNDRGATAEYDDVCDFYAHRIDCRVGRRTFGITIGFVGDDEILIGVESGIPRLLRFIGFSDEPERLQLVQLLHDILEEHGFRGVKWWTAKEWSGAQRHWSACPV
jgi:hypothetical protein